MTRSASASIGASEETLGSRAPAAPRVRANERGKNSCARADRIHTFPTEVKLTKQKLIEKLAK
jgi:hypothetical protein